DWSTNKPCYRQCRCKGTIYAFVLLLLLPASVGADSGDDFSNNLFSDLAPLLALFGERVTMQFLSQSMGWSDCIILSMAPLGIITTIVSAIRVGGPTWLKALIGRSRENTSAVEMELMSSTSHETCELWNGSDVEFICLIPREGIENTTSIRIMRLKEAVDKKLVQEQNPCSTDEETPKTTPAPHVFASDIIILRNTTVEAPNITLNRCHKVDRGHLHLAAGFGVILQLGVLVYFGFIAYFPSLRFNKDDKHVEGYAFPFSSGGTIILVLGMLLCAHVADRRTGETRYEPVDNWKTQIVWLQPKQAVSDQVFESFALYPQKCPQVMTVSRRDDDTGTPKAPQSGTGSQQSSNVRVTGVDRMTPLHCVAMKNRWLIAYKLLSPASQPADQFAVDNLGRAPIHLAVTRKYPVFTVIEFLSASVDVNGLVLTDGSLHSSRSGLWMSMTAADIVAAFLARGLLHMRGVLGYAGWRWLFLIEGLLSLLIGLASFAMMPPGPTETANWIRGKNGWFTAREEEIMVNRVIREDPSKSSMHNRERITPKLLWRSL
ncbi:putative uncharacterized transporter, partial [Fusarium culmorum]